MYTYSKGQLLNDEEAFETHTKKCVKSDKITPAGFIFNEYKFPPKSLLHSGTTLTM